MTIKTQNEKKIEIDMIIVTNRIKKTFIKVCYQGHVPSPSIYGALNILLMYNQKQLSYGYV